ncbi:transglycosylase SLT domain-containing protein [Candidatus Fermentibacteria bacterium]|nr:transglycosylase SLT domain-containing protein [Candidatus Fermentibacteria bacterium]
MRRPGTVFLAAVALSCTRLGGVEGGAPSLAAGPASFEEQAAILEASGDVGGAARLYSTAASMREPGDPLRRADALAACRLAVERDSSAATILLEDPSDSLGLILAAKAGGTAAWPSIRSLAQSRRSILTGYAALVAADSLCARGRPAEAAEAVCIAESCGLCESVRPEIELLKYRILLTEGDLQGATAQRLRFASDSILQSRMYRALGMWRLNGGVDDWEGALENSIRLWPAGDIHRSSWLLLREGLLEDSARASRLADALYSGGLWNELFELATASKAPPAHCVYLAGRTRDRLGFYGEACDLLGYYLDRWPSGPDAEQALSNLALDVARAGRPDSGLALLSELESRWPDSPRRGNIPWFRGSILAENGRWEEALLQFRRTAAEYPSNVTADDSHFFVCLGLVETGRHAGAVEELRAFLHSFPSSVYAPAAKYLLGAVMLRRMNDPAGADTLRRLAAESPESLPAEFARLLLGIDFQPPEVAEASLDDWMRSGGIGPCSATASMRAALVLIDAGLRRWGIGELKAAETAAGGAEFLAQFYLDHDIWERMPSSGWRLASRMPGPWPREVWMLRYPEAWPDEVLAASSRYGFDPLLTWSIMRQESMFQPSCYSPAGARGLIQMIPSTSEMVATEMGWDDYSPDRLYDPAVSLDYGLCYLSGVAAGMPGVVHLLAAYNGGPHNATGRWGASSLPDDMFFARITFNETRLYAEKVFWNYRIYRWLYPGHSTLVQQRFARRPVLAFD